MTPRIERLREYTVGKLQADGWKEIDWSKSPELVLLLTIRTFNARCGVFLPS